MMFVWGAPQHVYGPAVPPELVEAGGLALAVAEAERFGIQAIAPLFGTIRYAWPSAAETFVRKDASTRALRRYFERVSSKGCPASILLRITNVTVLRNIIHCEAGGERRVLHETYRTNERVDRAPGTEAELSAASTQPVADPDRDYLFVGSAGSFNYGHWLVDDLPRAQSRSGDDGRVNSPSDDRSAELWRCHGSYSDRLAPADAAA